MVSQQTLPQTVWPVEQTVISGQLALQALPSAIQAGFSWGLAPGSQTSVSYGEGGGDNTIKTGTESVVASRDARRVGDLGPKDGTCQGDEGESQC